MDEKTLLPPEHLGDGVYVEDVGYTLLIRVNDHRNQPVVELSPSVIEALITYYKRTNS